MSWGSKAAAKPPPAPPSSSSLSKLLPLIILLVVLLIAAFIAYHLYLAATQISRSAAQKLESKNVTFSKDGLKVGVKDIKNENYVDATQNFLVKAWNLSTWPEYRSRYWNKQDPNQGSKGVVKRKSYSRAVSDITTK